jgi:hypothetical protein
VVVEMPDQSLLATEPLDPQEDDSLIDELLASDPRFRSLVVKSKAGARKPFSTGSTSGFGDQRTRQSVGNAGYECPEIVSPDAFLRDNM